MVGCDVLQHRQQQAKDFLIGFEVALPTAAIHISQLYASLLATYQEVVLAVLTVKHRVERLRADADILLRFHKGIDSLQGIVYLFLNTVERQTEGIDTRLQTLQQVDGHQFLDTFLSSRHT